MNIYRNAISSESCKNNQPLLSFPLLRLPYLPMLDVLKNVDPIDLFALSTISKCAGNLVKSVSKTLKFELKIRIEYSHDKCFEWKIEKENAPKEEIETYFNVREDKMQSNMPTKKDISLRGEYYPMLGFKRIEVYWDDMFQGLEDHFEHFSNVFNVKEVSVEFHNSKDNLTKHVLNCFKKFNIKMQTVFLSEDFKSSHETYKAILDTAFPTASKIETKTTSEEIMKMRFRYETEKVEKPNLSTVQLHSAYFINSEGLMSLMNCNFIGLNKPNIGNKDLNDFLKTWMNGNHKVKNFKVTFNDEIEFVNMQLIMEGLEAQLLPEKENGLFRRVDQYEIKRIDGVTARIFEYRANEFHMTVD